MKKIGIIMLVVALAAIFVFAGCATPAPAPAPAPAPTSAPAPTTAPAPALTPIKLVYASWEGPDANNTVVDKDWMAEITKLTNGQVTFELAVGSVMAKPAEHYDLAVTGQADIAFHGLPYTPGRFPMLELWDAPIRAGTNQNANAIVYELFKKGYFDGDTKDVHVLYPSVDTNYEIQSRKGGKVIRTFEDLKGIKLRATGVLTMEIAKAFGSVPVGMPAPDVYSALDKGVIDAVLSPYGFVNAFRTEAVTGSVTEVSMSGMSFIRVMNLDTWNKLPANVQKVFNDLTPKYAEISGSSAQTWLEAGKKRLVDSGAEIVQFSDADWVKINNTLPPIWNNWFKAGEDKGLKRQEMVTELHNFLKAKGVANPTPGFTP